MPLDGLTLTVTSTVQWLAFQNLRGLSSVESAGDTIPPTPYTLSFGSDNTQGQANCYLYGYGSLAPGQSVTITLDNVQAPYLQANLNQAFAFALVEYIYVELLSNPDGSTPSSGVTLGGSWPGWFGGGSPTVDAGGVPYQAGSHAGKPVAAGATLTITNNDAVNWATLRIFGAGLSSP